MKKIVTLISLIVFTGISPKYNDATSPANSKEDSKLSSSCPYYIPATSNLDDSSEEGEVPTYIHCSVCQQGVLLGHEDGIVRCTYCGVKEKYNKGVTLQTESLK